MFQDFLKSKLFRIIVPVAILFLASTFAAYGGEGIEGSMCVSGGSGESENAPYIICTAKDLAALADQVNAGDNKAGKYYRLGKSIDLSAYGASYNGGKGWKPIGNNSNRFKGNFDGNRRTVSNLFINDASLDYAGLFGYIDSGKIKNLGVVDADITARSNAGGLAGFFNNSIIDNCYTTNVVIRVAGTTGQTGRRLR